MPSFGECTLYSIHRRGLEGVEGDYSKKNAVICCCLYIKLFIWKRFEECVREKTAHLATLKYTSIQVGNLLKETAEIESGLAEKPSWDQANRGQKLGLVWRNRKKISQIIKDYFCLPFFLLIILWLGYTVVRHQKIHQESWPRIFGSYASEDRAEGVFTEPFFPALIQTKHLFFSTLSFLTRKTWFSALSPTLFTNIWKKTKCFKFADFFLFGFCLVLEKQASVWFSSDCLRL